MFSLTAGRPIARIREGEHDKQIIGLVESDPTGKETAHMNDPIIVLGEDFFAERKTSTGRLRPQHLRELFVALKADKEPDDDSLRELYLEAKEEFEARNRKEFTIGYGLVTPLPDGKRRECPYVCGPSGAGKSTYVSKLIHEMRIADPQTPLFVFSRLDKDDIIDIHHPQRVPLSADMKITPEDVKQSICLFDDIDTIPDKKTFEVVQKLRDDLLETGRHEDVTVISTCHMMMNYKKTRVPLNEATSVTFFPGAGSSYHIKRYLKEHAGMEKKMIEKILKLPSRWVTLYRRSPQYIIYEKGCFLL